MSVEILKKTLNLVDNEDGIEVYSRKIARKKHTCYKEREKQHLRSVMLSTDVDALSGEICFVKRKQKHSLLDDAIPKLSLRKEFSLIEQYRKRRKNIDLLKRNVKYMMFTKNKQLDERKLERLLFLIGKKSGEEQESIRKLHAECNGLREVDPRKKKKEDSGSFFSDEDFLRIGKSELEFKNKKRKNSLKPKGSE